MSDDEDEEKMRKEIEKYRKQINKTKAVTQRRFKKMIDYLNSEEDEKENENDFNEALDDYENNQQINEKVENLLKESQNEYNNNNDVNTNFDNNDFMNSVGRDDYKEEIEAENLLEEIKKSCLNDNNLNKEGNKKKKNKESSSNDVDEEEEEEEEEKDSESEEEEKQKYKKKRKNKKKERYYSSEEEDEEEIEDKEKKIEDKLENFLNDKDDKHDNSKKKDNKKEKIKKVKESDKDNSVDKYSEDEDNEDEDNEDEDSEDEDSEDEDSEDEDSEDDIEAFKRWKEKRKLKKLQKEQKKGNDKYMEIKKKSKINVIKNEKNDKIKNGKEKTNEKIEKKKNKLKKENIPFNNLKKESMINSKNILRGKKGNKNKKDEEEFNWKYINNKKEDNEEKDKKNNMKSNFNNKNFNINNNNNSISEEDKLMNEKILSEIMQKNPGVKFSDIIGMKEMKQTLYEIIIIPTIRPDLFTGIRKPQRGILLFGPPGTGKTLIAKAIASECKSTFFNISSSSLTSKWVGESEKTVKSLFKIAYEKAPSIIFIDDIDSILSKRNESENEAMKRLKTEFLIQFDGLGSNSNAKLLVIAATNRPMDLDEALLRRLPKRIYCNPLDEEGRFLFIKKVINRVETNLSDEDIKDIANKTNNYSNSDLMELCREAAFEPVREKTMEEILNLDKFRALVKNDLENAIKKIRPSLIKKIIDELIKWNSQFGGIE